MAGHITWAQTSLLPWFHKPPKSKIAPSLSAARSCLAPPRESESKEKLRWRRRGNKQRRQARARSAYHRFDDRGLLPKGRLGVKFRVICCCFPMSVPHILCSKSTFCQIRSDIAQTYLAEAILMGGEGGQGRKKREMVTLRYWRSRSLSLFGWGWSFIDNLFPLRPDDRHTPHHGIGLETWGGGWWPIITCHDEQIILSELVPYFAFVCPL